MCLPFCRRICPWDGKPRSQTPYVLPVFELPAVARYWWPSSIVPLALPEQDDAVADGYERLGLEVEEARAARRGGGLAEDKQAVVGERVI